MTPYKPSTRPSYIYIHTTIQALTPRTHIYIYIHAHNTSTHPPYTYIYIHAHNTSTHPPYTYIYTYPCTHLAPLAKPSTPRWLTNTNKAFETIEKNVVKGNFRNIELHTLCESFETSGYDEEGVVFGIDGHGDWEVSVDEPISPRMY